jgi:hypothetical protein
MPRIRIRALGVSALTLIGAAALEGSAGDARLQEARDLLARCLQSQRLADRISMHGVTSVEFQGVPDDRPRRHRVEFWLRRDGQLVDLSFTWHVLGRPEASLRARHVVDKELSRDYSYRFSAEKRPRTGMVSKDTARHFAITMCDPMISTVLDGYTYFGGDGRRIPELMQDAVDLRVSGDAMVQGTLCKIVEGTTAYGFIRLWIAPSKGFTLHRFECTKGPNDTGARDWMGQPVVEHSAVLELVKVEKFGDLFFPVGGRLTVTRTPQDGLQPVDVFTYQRTKVDLHPNFKGTDAFVFDLPDGTVVTNLDDRDSGIRYHLREGKPAPMYREFTGDVKGVWPRVWKGARIVLAIASVLAFVAVACWIVWRRMARGA